MRLVRDGFSGKIKTTPAPLEICPGRAIWEKQRSSEYVVFVDESFHKFFGFADPAGNFCHAALGVPKDNYPRLRTSLGPLLDAYNGKVRETTGQPPRELKSSLLDLDHDGEKSLAAIQQSDLVPPPSYVLSTSPDKFQAIWKVEGFTQEQAEEFLHVLARQFDGDPAATDSTRVLRLPGFANKKYEEDFPVTVHSHTVGTYRPKDFKLRTEPVDSGPARWNQPRSHAVASAPRELSQSERDWAYAKRALARGLPPEEVMRDIAEFRAHEKHSPEDYARRTVLKAQKELDQGSTTGFAAEVQNADPGENSQGRGRS